MDKRSAFAPQSFLLHLEDFSIELPLACSEEQLCKVLRAVRHRQSGADGSTGALIISRFCSAAAGVTGPRYKRIENGGGFQWPRSQRGLRQLNWQEFCWLLECLSVDPAKAKSLRPYSALQCAHAFAFHQLCADLRFGHRMDVRGCMIQQNAHCQPAHISLRYPYRSERRVG